MTNQNPATQTAVRLVKATQKAYARKWAYLVAFLFMLFISVSILSSLDLLPNPSKKETAKAATTPALVAATPAPVVVATASELPMKIEIPAISLTTSVANPDTTDIEKLDAALLNGAVRYPTSSHLGEEGNIIVFGHSSYLPIVHNKAFKTFDGIQNLKKGDEIMVTGSDTTYVYAVQTVVKANAEADSIPLTTSGHTLTLATCNSFGSKADRFVVTATLVRTQ